MKQEEKIPRRVWRWFNPFGRQTGMWAFSINRLAAIGLTFYLYLHLSVLGKLAEGKQSFDSFIRLAKSPWYAAGEILVVVAVLLHGLNGIRVALTSFGFAVRYQKQLYYGLLMLTVIGGILFSIRILGI